MQSDIITKPKELLLEDLKIFFEAYHKTKIIEAKEDTLRMYILLSKNKNSTTKEKLINFKLLRLEERLFLLGEQFTIKEAIICEFLLEELQKYVSKSIRRN
ncbi:MAG: hypothetical protein SFU98_02720 [Leptospiraceae bacterium]|nr:hypothetical protein [Leptospiraceae bacterium]